MKYIENIRAHFEASLQDFESRLDGSWEAAAREDGWEPAPLGEEERESIEEAIRALQGAIGLLDGLSTAAQALLGLQRRPPDWPMGLSEAELNTERTMAMLGSGERSETAQKLDAEVRRRKEEK